MASIVSRATMRLNILPSPAISWWAASTTLPSRAQATWSRCTPSHHTGSDYTRIAWVSAGACHPRACKPAPHWSCRPQPSLRRPMGGPETGGWYRLLPSEEDDWREAERMLSEPYLAQLRPRVHVLRPESPATFGPPPPPSHAWIGFVMLGDGGEWFSLSTPPPIHIDLC